MYGCGIELSKIDLTFIFRYSTLLMTEIINIKYILLFFKLSQFVKDKRTFNPLYNTDMNFYLNIYLFTKINSVNWTMTY